MTLKSNKRVIALIMAFVLAAALTVPAFADDVKLAAPVLIPKGAQQITEGVGLGNSALHASCRSLVFEPVEGATGYNVYAYATKADAEADTNRVAVAENAQPTLPSKSPNGTTAAASITPLEDEVLIDVRLIQFKDIKEGATRTLPEGYTPAGMGDTWFPGDGTGDTTNLKPGQYWFRVQAADAKTPANNSDLSGIYEDGDAFSIAVGPDEAKDMIEGLLATKKLGDTLRIVDLRGAAEFSDEGIVRFAETDRHAHTDFNTVEKAEAIFGHAKDKSEVTIFVFCRGGGRAVAAARNLAAAGYTNVYNMQGVALLSFGLRYDDPTFRFRQVGEGEDGDLAPATDANSPAGISYDKEAGALRWYNIAQAKFNVYAFADEDETDVDKAVATGTLPVLPQDVTGASADWRFVRKFDLSTLTGLTDGETYYVRVQAAPGAEVPVKGIEPATIWGAPSELSYAVEITYKAVKPPAPLTVIPTPSTVLVNGKAAEFEAYNINDNNYFKLRDLALVINGSEKEFAVGWNGDDNAISLTSGKEYEAVGGEMVKGDGTSKLATPTTARVFLDGEEIKLTAYNINGNNFFRLRDLMKELDIGVTWDGETSTIGIDTSKPYTD